ncbi:MAG TPA: protein kinase [Pseudonocardiaceae bacterium]|nr:protein kinase [Pseudonocardiaceae bacterium]
MSGQGTVETGQDRRIADRYRLTGVIGSGGGGTVWTAVDEVLGREVAIKDVVVPPWLGDSERELARERTLREARAACRIDHPNVVDIYDVVEQDGRPWIVMRLLKAPSLAQVVEQDGPCSPQLAARIGLQVLGALRAAHTHGITHRDVKPSNVLVDGDRAVLTDFGIATIDGEASLTSPDALVGAPSYIAPERVRGEPATAASDLWSLGATLYAAVEGRPPHQREGIIAILTAVATDEPDPPRRAGPLTPLLTALLTKEPEKRPSAADVELFLKRIVSLTDAELTAVTGLTGLTGLAATAGTGTTGTGTVGLAGLGLGAGSTSTGLEKTSVVTPPTRRRRLPPVAAAAVLTLLAAVLGALALLSPGPADPPLTEQEPIGGSPNQAPAPVTSTGPVPGSGGDSRGVQDRPRTSAPAVQPPAQPVVEPSQPQTSVPASEQPTTVDPTPTGGTDPTETTGTEEPPPTTDVPPTSAAASATV